MEIVRPAARVIVLNGENRVLLLQFEDPDFAEPNDSRESLRRGVHWCPPGGGVEAGESHDDAARRELWEETGIRAGDLGKCIFTREKSHVLRGVTVHLQERYFLLRLTKSTVSIAQLTEFERDVNRGHRWWSLDELDVTTEAVFPEGLADLIRSRL